jgi:hypothetical protein
VGIPLRLAYRARLLRVARSERNLMSSIREQSGKCRSPRTRTYDNGIHAVPTLKMRSIFSV